MCTIYVPPSAPLLMTAAKVLQRGDACRHHFKGIKARDECRKNKRRRDRFGLYTHCPAPYHELYRSTSCWCPPPWRRLRRFLAKILIVVCLNGSWSAVDCKEQADKGQFGLCTPCRHENTRQPTPQTVKTRFVAKKLQNFHPNTTINLWRRGNISNLPVRFGAWARLRRRRSQLSSPLYPLML